MKYYNQTDALLSSTETYKYDQKNGVWVEIENVTAIENIKWNFVKRSIGINEIIEIIENLMNFHLVLKTENPSK